MAESQDNRYDAYLFTFKAEEWDEYEEFFDNWSADPATTEEWSSGKSKSIPENAPIFLMKQGKSPTGIIAAGFTDSENHPYKHWSRRKQKNVPGRANDLRFTHFLDPAKDKLLDISDLPRKYWASMASGIGLPSNILREIQRRWKALLGENAAEDANARTAQTLKDSEADNDYKISNKDTRATARRQIKERRGQRAFRQKMIGVYGGKCAISGCKITAVLEAAHIKSYLGHNDDNSHNGLLLRADLHTLFDLLLLGIHPETKQIHLHPSLRGSEYEKFDGVPLRRAKIAASHEALRLRWQEFETHRD